MRSRANTVSRRLHVASLLASDQPVERVLSAGQVSSRMCDVLSMWAPKSLCKHSLGSWRRQPSELACHWRRKQRLQCTQ